MRTILWILGILLFADVSGRRLLFKNVTRFDYYATTTTNNRRLLVYVPGILVDGKQSSLLMVPLWRQYGDVLLVSFDGTEYDWRQTAMDVAQYLDSHPAYDEIVFIGSSQGGPLAYNAFTHMKSASDRTVKFALLASPFRYRHLKGAGKASPFMFLWWAGPISNATTGKLYLKALFQKPKEENIEPGVNRDELKQRVTESQDSTFSVYTDQIRFVNSNHGPKKDSLKSLEGVYILCERDEIVNASPYGDWKAAFGGRLTLVRSDTTHVGFSEMPEAFMEAFVDAFAAIGVEKD